MSDDQDHGVGFGVFLYGAIMLVFWAVVFIWWKAS
jgi:hypothetical protein